MPSHTETRAETVARREEEESQAALQDIDIEEARRRRTEEVAREQERVRREQRAVLTPEERAERQRRSDILEGRLGRDAPQAGDVFGRGAAGQAAQFQTPAEREAFRQQQLSLAQQLTGPIDLGSAAQRQLQVGTERNLSQLLAAQATARGGPGAAASQRGLLRQQAGVQQQAAGQAADLRLQEQNIEAQLNLQRQQALGGVLAGARGQDIGVRGQDIGAAIRQAELEQQTALANQQALLQEAGFDVQVGLSNLAAELQTAEGQDRLVQFLVAQGFSEQEAQRQARVQTDAISEAARQADLQRGQERFLEEAAAPSLGTALLGAIPGVLGGAAGGAGAAIAASGQDFKTDIKRQGGSPLASALASTRPGTSLGRSRLESIPALKTAGGSGVGGSRREDVRRAISGQLPMPFRGGPGFPVIATGGGGAVVGSGVDFKTDIQRFTATDFIAPRLRQQAAGPSPLATGFGQLGAGLAQAGLRELGEADASAQAAGAASGKELKFNIQAEGGEQEVQDFLGALEAFTFRYKDPERFGEGRHAGVMAEDLEASGPIGKSMVEDTPDGKMVHFGKGFGAILAAQVELNGRLERLEDLEKGSGKK